MGKKEKRRGEEKAKADGEGARPPIISKSGWKVIGTGVGIAVLGYIVLCFTDPRGQNFASQLSPFLILGGYLTIGAGILVRDRPA